MIQLCLPPVRRTPSGCVRLRIQRIQQHAQDLQVVRSSRGAAALAWVPEPLSVPVLRLRHSRDTLER